MSEHIIYTTLAAGEPFIPSFVEGEQENNFWVEWTKPGSQDTVVATSAFIIKFNRPLDLTELTLQNFELHRVMESSPLSTQLFDNPFEEFSTADNYDSISRELTLVLKNPLPALTEYFLVITGLKDTTGIVQTEDHIVLFAVAGTGTEYEADIATDVDHIIIEDYTLIAPPAISGITSSAYSLTCVPTGNSIFVASTLDTITIQYNGDVNTALISVNEENLATGTSTNLSIVVNQDPVTFLATISLPNQSTESPANVDGPYINTNCLYTVDAIVTTFQFTGVLNPFYVPLSHFLPYTTAASADPIGWARLVYIMSKEVEARMGDNATLYLSQNPEAVRNFTKYLILTMFASSSSNEGFMLGELQIQAGQSMGLNTLDYKTMLDQWESALFGFGHTTRTVNVMAPRATSNLPYSRSSKRYLERVYGTFDRRFDY